MSNLKIVFNYIYPTVEFFKDDGNKKSGYYEMKDFCEWLIANKKSNERPKLNVPLDNGELAGIEWKDCTYDEEQQLYYFRLKKLRSNNIPAYSYTDLDSDSITLKKNQYLGEFNLIIFDSQIKRLVIQRNSFGLTLGQISTALSFMRTTWLRDKGETIDEDDPGFVKLNLILDADKTKNVKNNDIYRSFDLKLADVKSILNMNNSALSSAIDLVNEVDGVSINVKVSLARRPKKESLKKDFIHRIIDAIQKIHNTGEASLTLKARKTIDDPIDEIDVLVPKLTSTTILKNTQRSTIGAEYVYHNFIDQNYSTGMRNKAQRNGIS